MKKKEKKDSEKKENENNEDIDDEDNKEEEEETEASTPIELPESWEVPKIVLDGKWYPPGFPTYIIYVCKFTWINDDHIHLYECDGKALDKSKAMSRKREMEKIRKRRMHKEKKS